MASEIFWTKHLFELRGKISVDSGEFTCSAKSLVGPLIISFRIFREAYVSDFVSGLFLRFEPTVEKQPWASVPNGKLTVWQGETRNDWLEAGFTFSWPTNGAGRAADIVHDYGDPFFGRSGYCASLGDLESQGLLQDGDFSFWVGLEMNKSLQQSCLPLDWSKQMWADMLFTDMYLVSKDGEEIPCHRAVLCGASSVFKAMLTGRFKEATHNEVIVHHATAKDIRSFLEFVYTNGLPSDLDVGALAQILRMADMYDISALSEICSSMMLPIVDKGNVAEAVDALMPHYQSEGGLANKVERLIDMLQQDRELLVAALPKARTLSSFSSSPDSEIHADPLPGPTSLAEAEQGAQARFLDGEKVALPLLQPEHHQHVEVDVLRFPLPAPGLEPPSSDQSSEPSDKLSITVLSFNRCTEHFSKVLRSSDLAQALSKQNVEVEPDWANGAKVFVSSLRPDKLESVMKLDSLRPWHVIVRSEDEPEVGNVIDKAWRSGCFRSKRPRIRQDCTRRLLLPSEDQAGGAASVSHAGVPANQDEGSACEYMSTADQFSGHHVSLDTAGTVPYPIPISVSPRSIFTSPI